ncbi:MAG: hypothetical protein ABFC34_15970 [Methanobacterium sp.]
MKIDSQDLKEFIKIESLENDFKKLGDTAIELIGAYEHRLSHTFEAEVERTEEGLKFRFNIAGKKFEYTSAYTVIRMRLQSLPRGEHTIEDVFPHIFYALTNEIWNNSDESFNRIEMYDKAEKWFEQSLSVLTVPEEDGI